MAAAVNVAVYAVRAARRADRAAIVVALIAAAGEDVDGDCRIDDASRERIARADADALFEVRDLLGTPGLSGVCGFCRIGKDGRHFLQGGRTIII